MRTPSTPSPDAEFMDANGVKAHFGISKPMAYQLWHAGDIESVSIRKQGKLRGKRLFVVQSIRDFLASQRTPRTQKDTPEAQK